MNRFKKQTQTAAIALTLLFAVALPGCGRPQAGVAAAGSTSVQPYAEILAEEFSRLYHGDEIDVQGGGSAAGITAAESGIADIGMSSRNLKDSELERGLRQVEIARDGLAVIVHPDNPVQSLSIEQLRDIYAGEITSWSEAGGTDAKIHLIAREEGSGTRSAFEDLLMGETRITPKAIVQNSNGAVKQIVSNDRNAVGFISLGLVNGEVRALELGGIAATHDNIVNGSYELYRPFLFITSGEPTGAAKEFVEFVLSEHGQELLAQKGLIPVAEGLQS